MCKFFKNYEIKTIKIGGLVLSAIPALMTIVFYSQAKNDLALQNLCWFVGSLASFGTGYMLANLKRTCNLPHVAQNIQVAEREGEPSEIHAINNGI